MDHARLLINGNDDCNLTGAGIGVAVLDTGCAPHPDLSGQIGAFCDILGHRALPYDDNGHGTHVCGIIAGNGSLSDGRFRGIAPGCTLIPVKVLDRQGSGRASDVLAGLRWIRQHLKQFGIRIVNISVGSFSRRNMGENSVLVRGVDTAWDAGLVVVVAAGNRGPERSSITTPGISRKVITVGCSDDEKENLIMGNRMVHYSGRGPTCACICKPDIIAPGASITSCCASSQGYIAKSGTSMATPLVTGAIALLLEKYPEMSNRDVKLRLRERAVDLGLSHNQQGWGRVDLKRLLE